MRLRVRSRSGVEPITVDADATIDQLYQRLSASSIRYGFPPQPVPISTPTDSPLSSILRDGDVIIVTPSTSGPNIQSESNKVSTTATPTKADTTITREVIEIPDTSPSQPSPPISSFPPPSSASSSTSLAAHGSVELRQVPDDNSCLFRCVGAVSGIGRSESMTLRKVISDVILSRTHDFPAAILEKEPADYAAWIQSDHAWGGPIELLIFADHFQMRIAAFDLLTMRLDTYGEQYPNVAYLIFNGIHYNYCALAIKGMDQDITQFPADDDLVMEKVKNIAQKLHDSKQYTNTNTFSLRCVQCGTFLDGASHANKHAAATGHTQFDEINK